MLQTTASSIFREPTARRAVPYHQYFYSVMSLLIALVVVYGFSHTVDANLIHATPRRSWIVYVHGAVFSGWIIFFALQSLLVRLRNVRLHRSLGMIGAAFGLAIPLLGVSTAIVMARFRGLTDSAPLFAVQLWDMSAFGVAFNLGILWRKRPEFHRRLMLIASCMLTSAAFARFPIPGSQLAFYAGVDLLVLCGAFCDWITMRRLHIVYQYALPSLIAGQSGAMYLLLSSNSYWVKLVKAILQ